MLSMNDIGLFALSKQTESGFALITAFAVKMSVLEDEPANEKEEKPALRWNDLLSSEK
jgi:hypothetical protein